ncbi:MAG: TatD family hydrolase [Bacillales bacterium]|nr:TatD family hydrolase [Bacillales bacterium]
MIFDTHCHLYDEKYIEGPNQAIKTALDNNVGLLMIPGDNLPHSIIASKLSKEFNEVYAAVGIHPEEIDSIDIDEALIELEKLVKENPKIKAIGEIGLDKYWNNQEEVIAKQKEYFIKQIELANKLHLPVIIHDREAHGDTLEILKKYPPLYGGVLHCFSGSVEFMKEIIKLGFYIGIDGPVTYKNAIKVKEVVSELPLDKMVIETDSPYMTPVPLRGKINCPHYLKYVIDEISRIKSIDSREIEYTTYNNGKKLFRI